MNEQASARCAVWARAERVAPIGTATPFETYLLIEWPKPWPPDMKNEPRLAPVAEALGANGRLNALVPAEPDGSTRRVILYRRPVDVDDWFVAFQHAERVVDAADVVDAAVDLLRAGSASTATAAHDIIICAHGTRDTCCAARGTVLTMDLAGELAAGSPTGTDPTTRLWTSSHIGSHHFAPNAMVFPEGTAWGRLSSELAGQIVRRQGLVDGVLSHYRGCAGLTTPQVQAVERHAFAEIGWDWLDYRRRGVMLANDVVRLEAVSPAGEHRGWEATVRTSRTLAVPPCRPDADPPNTATDLVVSDVT